MKENFLVSPLVSIIIPCYNHSKFIRKTIESVVAQDYLNIELIIIDDGSKDDSVACINELLELCQKRFKRFEFRHRENKGLCATLNEALHWCQGVYFSPTASDDFLAKNKISKQVSAFIELGNPNLAGVFSGVNIIDEHDRVVKTLGFESFFGFKDIFLRKAFIPGQAVMLSRNIVLSVGGYDERKRIEDLYLFLKISEKGFVFKSIKEGLVFYRRHDDNLSSKSDIIWGAVYSILLDYKNDPLFKEALSRSMMIHAHDLQRSSKIKSLNFVFKSVNNYPRIIFSSSFVKWCLKFFIKSKVYK